MTSNRLPRQHARSTKRPSKLQLLKIVGKTESVTAQNFEIETIFFRRFYFRFALFTPYFHFRCVSRATFDRNLIHSADARFLVMACAGYLRAQLKNPFEPP